MRKLLCLLLSLVSIIYSLFYASFGGFKGNAGALSKIGLTHPILFFVWGLLTCLALFFNIVVGFQKTKYKFYILLLIIAFVGMALTVCFDFDYSKLNEYYLHCIGSMTFSIVTSVTVFLLFLLSKNYTLATISAIIVITDLLFLIIYKETAIIELTPIFAGYIMLIIHNLSREKQTIETK